jgi:hypothetical protein
VPRPASLTLMQSSREELVDVCAGVSIVPCCAVAVFTIYVKNAGFAATARLIRLDSS